MLFPKIRSQQAQHLLKTSLEFSARNVFIFSALFVLVQVACGDSPKTSAKQNDKAKNQPQRQASSPTSTAPFQGDAQKAEVNSPVSVAPGILVTDAKGAAVAGVEVSFSLTQGKGSISPNKARTNSQGVASIKSWVLGPTPGINELKAEVPGLAPVFFRAQGLPDARGSFLVQAGSNANARVSEKTETPPTVIFLNQDGTPSPNRVVSFRVAKGAGSLVRTEATTDAQGFANAGSWTLGPVPGEQVVIASSAGMPDLEFVALAVSNQEPVLKTEKILGGLNHPWELVALPDGSLLFTERGGSISILPPGATQKIVLATPTDIPNSQKSGAEQSGHLGLVLDPQFASNRFVYSFVSSILSNPVANRIRKWKMAEDFRSLTFQDDILAGMTFGSNGGHSGGRMAFGPDGFLYVATGDTRSATVPQDLRVLGGKLLRINSQGAAAPGNPNLGQGSRPEIFAYGFRNAQGLAFRPSIGGGGVFTCEHGPNQDDEVTKITNGGNGGWNPNDGNGNYNGYSGAIMTDLKQFPKAMKPAFMEADSNGMSDCVFLEGSQWKSWEGKLAVGMLAGQKIFLADLNASGSGLLRPLKQTFVNQGRVRSLTLGLGPDRSLYVVVDANSANDGRIMKLTPQ